MLQKGSQGGKEFKVHQLLVHREKHIPRILEGKKDKSIQGRFVGRRQVMKKIPHS